MRLTFRPSFPNGRGAGAAPAWGGTRSGMAVAQAMSNWPSLTPETNASHSCGVNRSTGPSGSLESRRSTSAVTNPTSTQAGLLAPEKELLRNTEGEAVGWSYLLIVASFRGCRRHHAGDKIQIGPLTWSNYRATNWARTWERTWAATWDGSLPGRRVVHQ